MDIIERFGAYISKEVPQHPDRCRALLLAAFRAYRLKLRFAAPKEQRTRDFLSKVL